MARKKSVPKKNAGAKRRLAYSRFTGGTACTLGNEVAIKTSVPRVGHFSKVKLPNGSQLISSGPAPPGSRSRFPSKGEMYRI